MNKTKFAVLLILLLVGAYAVSMYFVPENKTFTVEKEIAYPVDKVYPQFSNLQNFASWNAFFGDNKDISLAFFSPYEGQGSSLTYFDHKDSDRQGDLFIRYANPEKTLKIQLFDGRANTPYAIDIKFISASDRTKLVWFIQTPKQPFLKRSLNLLSEDFWHETIDRSMKNLANILGRKIERETARDQIKFDTITVEQQEAQILLGISAGVRNTKDALFRNVVITHNKVLNYVTMDLGRKSDEYGEPIMLAGAEDYKSKEISYFYGVAVPARIPISDNNFTFRTLNPSTTYTAYYRGTYAGRAKTVQQLLAKARRDTMRNGMLQEVFLEEPADAANVVLKLSLPVYK